MGYAKLDRRKEIGKRLRTVRKARGLSQIDIAEACEVSRAAVSQWEAGLVLAEMPNLERAAERLNCEVEWLRTGDGTGPVLQPLPVGARRAMRFAASAVDIGAWSKRPDEPPFTGAIAEIDNRGTVPVAKAVDAALDWWRLPPSLLQERGHQGAKLRIFRVFTDMMEPTIPRNSHVLIDLDQRKPDPHEDAIFAIDNGFSIVLKKLVVDPNGKTITLQDSGPRALKLPLKKIKVVGRCIAHFEYL